MQHNKLVMMANQIAMFFSAQGEKRAVPQIAAHIEQFWDPRMREKISALVEKGETGLSPLAREALAVLKPIKRPNL